MADPDLAPAAVAGNPDPISEIIARWDAELEAPRPAVWGDFFTCTGCRDLEECRAAFGGEWSPDGTGCADWTPRRVTLAHMHLGD